MSDDVNQQDQQDQDTPEEVETGVETSLRPEDELKMLKERAKTLGIPISGNVGVDTLKKKIEAKLSGSQEPSDEGDSEEGAEPVEMTKKEREQAIRKQLQKDKMKLVRCRIYNLNPSKRDLRGEIVTVANRYLGTVRKFIPFGEATDNGYHIPQVIFDDLKSRKFQQVRTDPKTGEITGTRMVPEYSLEVMPALTKGRSAWGRLPV